MPGIEAVSKPPRSRLETASRQQRFRNRRRFLGDARERGTHINE